MEKQSTVSIYQTSDGSTQVEVQFDQNTAWLNQAQIVELFERDQSVISRHIRNAFNGLEISEESNMQKMHIALNTIILLLTLMGSTVMLMGRLNGNDFDPGYRMLTTFVVEATTSPCCMISQIISCLPL